MLTEQFMRDYYACYNSEDAEALRRFYHPEVKFFSAQGEQIGDDAIIGTYRYLMGRFEDRMTPENILIDGDQAAVEITDRFTARADIDDFLGHSLKQGEQLVLHLCAIYRVKNRQIVSACIYQR